MKATKQKKEITTRLPTTGEGSELAHAEIARLAYSIWEQQGRPHGQDVEIWLQAEAQLRKPQSQHGLRA